jgi:hypothetical protein
VSRNFLTRARTTLALAAVLVPVALLTIVGLIRLWPNGSAPRTGIVAVAAEYPEATVVSAKAKSCTGANEDRAPDGTIPSSVACTFVTAELTGSDGGGEPIEVWAPATVRPADLTPGTRIVLVRYLPTDTESEVWA